MKNSERMSSQERGNQDVSRETSEQERAQEEITIAEVELREKYQKYLQLDKEELAKRLAYLEWRIERTSPELLTIINGIGEWFRGIRRDYLPVEGILLRARLVPDEFEIWAETETRQWGTDVVIHEQKIVKVPAKSLLYYEVIPVRQILEMKEQVQQMYT